MENRNNIGSDVGTCRTALQLHPNVHLLVLPAKSQLIATHPTQRFVPKKGVKETPPF